MNDLKEVLKRIRMNAGISQKDLAIKFDTDQSHISRIESGKFSCYHILNWYYRMGRGVKHGTESEEDKSN